MHYASLRERGRLNMSKFLKFMLYYSYLYLALDSLSFLVISFFCGLYEGSRVQIDIWIDYRNSTLKLTESFNRR